MKSMNNLVTSQFINLCECLFTAQQKHTKTTSEKSLSTISPTPLKINILNPKMKVWFTYIFLFKFGLVFQEEPAYDNLLQVGMKNEKYLSCHLVNFQNRGPQVRAQFRQSTTSEKKKNHTPLSIFGGQISHQNPNWFGFNPCEKY